MLHRPFEPARLTVVNYGTETEERRCRGGYCCHEKLVKLRNRVVSALDTLVIGGAFIIGTVYAIHLAYVHFSQNEQAMIKAAADAVGVDPHQLGDAIEAYKQANGIPNDATVPFRKMKEIAEAIKKFGDYWSTK